MRSRQEILFRLRQEASNVWLRLARPRVPSELSAPLPVLPEPWAVADAVRNTPHAEELVRVAESVLARRFPLLGTTVESGPEIEWRRDYVSGLTSPLRYFRFVPYLDAARVGDHKVVWELNRHQHWVALAQAHLLTGRREFLNEIERESDSWVTQNPFLQGINWASALEVAFRAMSWVWVYHLAGQHFDAAFRERFVSELYRHGLYLEHNLSVYFSPNTHLLGEAVALQALGTVFSVGRSPTRTTGMGTGLRETTERWAETGARIVREQLESQVRDDGSHFEQSSYYHVYALDMFLFSLVLGNELDRQKLARMCDYLAALMGPERRLPFLGDDDGGRLFYPHGDRETFGRATLATASALLKLCDWPVREEDGYQQAVWWLGPEAIRCSDHCETAPVLYQDAGVAVLTDSELRVIADAGPFGYGSAGHSHSDTLSLVVRARGADVLIDPGTYTYVGDPEWRERFRGSAAHNTVRIDGLDQGTPAGPFRWVEKPEVEVLHWQTSPRQDYLDARCSYKHFTHRRRVLLSKPGTLIIVDEIDGPPGEHLVEQFWHLAGAVTQLIEGMYRLGDGAAITLATEGVEAEIVDGWRSRAFGSKLQAPVLRVSRKATLPVRLATMLDTCSQERPRSINILQAGERAFELRLEGPITGVVRFTESGPVWEKAAD